jgi:hypothetical protein
VCRYCSAKATSVSTCSRARQSSPAAAAACAGATPLMLPLRLPLLLPLPRPSACTSSVLYAEPAGGKRLYTSMPWRGQRGWGDGVCVQGDRRAHGHGRMTGNTRVRQHHKWAWRPQLQRPLRPDPLSASAAASASAAHLRGAAAQQPYNAQVAEGSQTVHALRKFRRAQRASATKEGNGSSHRGHWRLNGVSSAF